MTIFVQIAAYRDPQLIPTIKKMLENAKRPKNLRLGIARQFHPEDGFDDLSEFDGDKRFRILDIPYEESTGVCWARNLTQQLYEGEDYTLQIDSHMRFEKDWDDTLIKMIKQLQKKGHKKPLLTGYVSSFDPENDPQGRVNEPWRMAFDRFTPEGVVFFLPETIPGWKELKEPVPARFYSAHFAFTLGVFSTEVQHDPEFYFRGSGWSARISSSSEYFILAGPVRPGRMDSSNRSSPVSLSAYPGTSGRGPTKLISPIKIFQSSGNSSSLYLRKTAPSGVILLSPLTDMELPPWFTAMVRNLCMTNKWPYRPTRFCENNTGPPGILILINTAITT